MGKRVQVILSESEREAFRRQAAPKKMSLSSWLRAAGIKQLETEQERPLRSVEDVQKFFASLPDQPGAEPDRGEHLHGMAESRRSGSPPS